MLSTDKPASRKMTVRMANWPLVCRVSVIIRLKTGRDEREASQIATPAMIAKTATTSIPASGLRPPRKIEIASSGPNSPAAPVAVTARPNGECRSPSSRSTGIRVPSAVEVKAIPMNTPVIADGASRMPTTTPTISEISQPRQP